MKRNLLTLLAMSLLLGQAKLKAQNSWPIFRGDQRLSGLSSAQLSNELKLLWSFKTDDEIKSSPVISFDQVYIGSGDGNIYALHLKTGKLAWKDSIGNTIEAPPLVVDQKVVIGSLDGFVYAYDALRGKLLWKFETGGNVIGSANWTIAPKGKTKWIFVGSYDFNLYCLDSENGKKIWTFEAENYINGAPSLQANKIIFGGCDAHARIISLASGKEEGAIDVGAYIPGSTAIDGNFAYLGHYGNEVVCIELKKKNIAWRYGDSENGDPFFSSPAIGQDRIVIGCRDNQVHCISKSTGKKIWTFQTQGEVDSSPVIANDKVIVGSNDGRLYLIALNDGSKIWSYEIGSPITSSPAVVDGMVVIAAEDGGVYTFGNLK
jgi:eukaryotic-like serine/threonine-protein kinase